MTSSQMLGVMITTALFSVVLAATDRLQSFLKLDHRLRVRFLRQAVSSLWLVALVSIVILSVGGGHAVGELFPRTASIGRAVRAPQVLVFEGQNSPVVQLILRSYLLGVTFMVGRLFRSYLAMRKLLLNSSSESLLGASIRSTELAESPFSFGFLNTQIFIPKVFLLRQSKEVLRVALIHEKKHVQNRDPQWKLLSLLTRAVFFFAPGAWYLHRKLDLESEIECDRLTMREAEIDFREYGSLLIDAVTAIQTNRQSPMFMYMSDNNLRRRIEAMKAKTVQRRSLPVIFATLMLVVGATAIATTAGVARFKGQYKVKVEVLIDDTVVSTPQFIVLPNESASLEMKSEHPESTLRMMLTASDYPTASLNDGIELKMAVEFKNKDQSFRTNPRIVVAPGEEGSVTVANSGEKMEIKVTAERQ